MRPPQPLPGGARKELTRLLQTVDSQADYRRVLCLWLRAALGLPAAAVTLALGWRTSSVYNLPSRYQHAGAGALFGTGRGGRRRAWFSPEQEQRLLDSFTATAGQGGRVEAGAMCRAYEQQVGHAVAPSPIYRLLARHGWRKLVPRPHHPDASREGQEAFKKAPPCGAHRIPTPSTARFGAALDV
jgi:transposase